MSRRTEAQTDNRYKKTLRENKSEMTLKEWLTVNKVTSSLFAKWLGVTALTIERICRNQLPPRKYMAIAIAYLTNDKVLFSDFQRKPSSGDKRLKKRVFVEKVKAYPNEPIITIRYNADE